MDWLNVIVAETPWMSNGMRLTWDSTTDSTTFSFSDKLEDMKYHRPHYHSMWAIAMQINHAQVVGVLNKAPLDPAQSWARIVSVRNFQTIAGVGSTKPDVEGYSTSFTAGTSMNKNVEVQPRSVNPTLRRSLEWSENRHFCPRSEVWCNRTSPLSGSSSEGSEGTHLVLMYVDARPRPYLVKA